MKNIHKNDWNQFINNLNSKVDSNTETIANEFEEQKHNLKTFVKNAEENLSDMKNYGNRNYESIKQRLDELKVQAHLAKAETRDALEDNQKKITKSLQNLERELESAYNNVENKTDRFIQYSTVKTRQLHTDFDMFRLHFHLAKQDGKEAYTKTRRTIKNHIEDLSKKYNKIENKASEKTENFINEISSSWKHLKQAF